LEISTVRISSPVVDILKQVAMDHLQVFEIEIACRDALACARGREPTLGKVQFGRIQNAQPVS
jgi:hypothetical protein